MTDSEKFKKLLDAVEMLLADHIGPGNRELIIRNVLEPAYEEYRRG